MDRDGETQNYVQAQRDRDQGTEEQGKEQRERDEDMQSNRDRDGGNKEKGTRPQQFFYRLFCILSAFPIHLCVPYYPWKEWLGQNRLARPLAMAMKYHLVILSAKRKILEVYCRH